MHKGDSSNDRRDEESLPILEARIRAALLASRGNEKLRDHLVEIVRDRDRFETIVKTLGPSHAHIHDLLAIAHHVDAVRSFSGGFGAARSGVAALS